MKKQRKPSQKKRKAQAPRAPAVDQSRRDLMRKAPYWALGGAAVLGGGYWAVGAVRAGAAEYDLSRIGQGKPTVVQIHDPQCPVCNRLQKQARAALEGFGECDLVYLVANIRTGLGEAFAAEHRVPHVTLLLFDGAGALARVLSGPQDASTLRKAFEAHLAA